ncbi:MAG: recombinase RecQ [Leptolyngbya sp.]|nr:MAG: recombinase RecQ [Leptolyngbya sp.]
MTAQPIKQSNQPVNQTTIQATLQQIWGYSSFRSPQREIVDCLLQQRDALIILPTGGGKSVCFQLPALMQPGLTLVVSPLVALMENQVQELHQRDRRFQQSVALLHSELARSLSRQTLLAVEHQRLRLLYLSPETLLSPPVWERLCKPELKINRLVLDEAHCLVQWGDTFRPAYYRLGAVRSALVQAKPAGSQIAIAAFTATADPVAQQTIQRVLQLNQPQIFRQNPYRANLDLTVQVVWTPRQRRSRLLQFIQAHPKQSGLVYVRSRRDGEELAEWLTQQGFSTAAYHAGLYAGDRRQIEQDWIANTLQFVICTSAFGMGINKSNVRWIVHFHAPLLLSEYVQEVGRAGRDGNPAHALTLISEPTGWLDSQDKQRRQFFETQSQKHYRTAQDLVGKLPLQGEVFTVSKQFPGSAIALSLLHQSGCLDWADPFHYTLQPGAKSPKFSQSNITAAQQMTDYLHTKACRWQFLLTAFGFTHEAQSFRCGHCDTCRR